MCAGGRGPRPQLTLRAEGRRGRNGLPLLRGREVGSHQQAVDAHNATASRICANPPFEVWGPIWSGPAR